MKTDMNKDRIENYLKIYGTDGKFFLLTRDHPATITTVGGGHGDVGWEDKNCLYHYGNQVLNINDRSAEVDDFGRNLKDRLFIGICLTLYIYAQMPSIKFKSLSTRKDGDKYLVRVQYNDSDLEMEVEEMFNYLHQKLRECG